MPDNATLVEEHETEVFIRVESSRAAGLRTSHSVDLDQLRVSFRIPYCLTKSSALADLRWNASVYVLNTTELRAILCIFHVVCLLFVLRAAPDVLFINKPCAQCAFSHFLSSESVHELCDRVRTLAVLSLGSKINFNNFFVFENSL